MALNFSVVSFGRVGAATFKAAFAEWSWWPFFISRYLWAARASAMACVRLATALVIGTHVLSLALLKKPFSMAHNRRSSSFSGE